MPKEEQSWRFTRLNLRMMVFMVFLNVSMITLFFVAAKQSLSLSQKTQGLALLRFRDRVVSDPFGALSNWNDKDGFIDPCSWFGVECTEGKIVALILRNNSFSGEIPNEITQLKKLKVPDLRHNNFSGSFPSESNPSLTRILRDHNDYLENMTQETFELKKISESHANEDLSKAACVSKSNMRHMRKLLQISNPPSQVSSPSESPSKHSPSASPPISFPPSHIIAPTPEISFPPNPPIVLSNPPQSNGVSAPPSPPTAFSNQGSPKPKHHSMMMICYTVGGFSFLVLVSAIAFACFRNTKVVTVKPWPISLSGQLKKAFVKGVPSLKRAELEAACEDFSNIIGSLPEGTIYKGTLSSGVEIAVVSTIATSHQNWSKHMEGQFKKKLETLSRVNHKNFLNLIGFCEEKRPFTRMMVFEYAPNGTLYEHLHIREAEQLDWEMRKRIAMGIAYCLEHMHQLTPPIAHTNLQSSSICLTEDYAAKISDLSFRTEIVTSIKRGSSAASRLLETPLAYTKGNVYSFGLILFELITGKIPYTEDNGILTDWAAEYLRWEKRPFIDLVDPTLSTLKEEEVERWFQVMRECVNSDPEKRPTMREVTATLKEITAMEPDEAAPKSSPLWWAELEIVSEFLS